MTDDATPAKVRLTDVLGPLVACPLCGKQDGYGLAEGDTYRWWLVQCKACGAGVAECHSDRRTQAGTVLPETCMAAHEAWNEAGKHAHELRCALYEADMLAGHDDAFTEWREKWAHLWALLPNARLTAPATEQRTDNER
jgi:hypothetical protein